MALDVHSQSVLVTMAVAAQPGAPYWELSAPGTEGLPVMHQTESNRVRTVDSGEIVHSGPADEAGIRSIIEAAYMAATSDGE